VLAEPNRKQASVAVAGREKVNGRMRDNIVDLRVCTPSPSGTNPPGEDLHLPAGWRTGQSDMIRLG
jgi:hypothetical protein